VRRVNGPAYRSSSLTVQVFDAHGAESHVQSGPKPGAFLSFAAAYAGHLPASLGLRPSVHRTDWNASGELSYGKANPRSALRWAALSCPGRRG